VGVFIRNLDAMHALHLFRQADDASLEFDGAACINGFVGGAKATDAHKESENCETAAL
jgi:hypothetical protein